MTLFRDPVHDGAADPTVIYHRKTATWRMFYTARRADLQTEGVAWAHGTDIGVATSDDGGRTWGYRGVALGLAHEPGRNTYWAPEVLWHDGQYHMYVSYIRGIRTDWSGERHILHYTSHDLARWRFVSTLELSSDRVIDACVWPLPDGRWRMWYKDEGDGSTIHAADSPDLFVWRPIGRVLGDRPQEGPSVFRHGGSYWMVTDPWNGLGVYRSPDLHTWTRGQNILAGIADGPGHHACALSQVDNVYLFYFTHPGGGQRSCVRAASVAARNASLVVHAADAARSASLAVHAADAAHNASLAVHAADTAHNASLAVHAADAEPDLRPEATVRLRGGELDETR